MVELAPIGSMPVQDPATLLQRVAQVTRARRTRVGAQPSLLRALLLAHDRLPELREQRQIGRSQVAHPTRTIRHVPMPFQGGT